MIYSCEYKPVIEDYTKERNLSITAIVKMMENAANGHSKMAGDDIFETERIKTAWILTDWQIQLDEYPNFNDELKVETWSETVTSPLVANRDFLLYKNGNIFGRAATRWVLFDLEAKRLGRIDDTLIEKYKPEEKFVFEEKKLSKIEIPESFDSETKITIRRSDIDFNNHVHNLVYLDYALESLPEDVYKNSVFKNIRITYKTAITESREIICKYKATDGKHTVLIYDDAGNLCTMIQLW